MDIGDLQLGHLSEDKINNAPSEEDVRENDENRPLIELFVKV